MMKKIFLILLFPFLVSFQCEEDFDNTGFETAYFISNESGTDLFLLNDSEQFNRIDRNEGIFIGSALNQETSPIPPSASLLFNSIRLYRSENGNYIQVYTQEPLDDTLWTLAEPTENRFEYTLTITDASLD